MCEKLEYECEKCDSRTNCFTMLLKEQRNKLRELNDKQYKQIRGMTKWIEEMRVHIEELERENRKLYKKFEEKL